MTTQQSTMQITGIRQHEAWLAKTMPEVEQLAGGVWSIPVPVPDNPIRYTSSYLLIGDGESVLVDPGWDSDAGWAALLAGLAAAGSTPEQLSGIVLTHVHPDHHAMTSRLQQVTDLWVGMHAAEAGALPRHPDPMSDAEWFVDKGVPADVMPTLMIDVTAVAPLMLMPDPTVTFDDGEKLPLTGRSVRAIWTPGHSPGHLCLHDEDNDLLLTGDHVLPRISPNVGLQKHSAPTPLAPYQNSLEKLRPYESAEVLPAHEWRFRGLNARIDQLLAHHAERCDEIIDRLTERPAGTCWELAQRLSWSRGWDNVQGFQRRAALAETAAHLDYLVDGRRVSRRVTGTGATGYSAT